MNTYPPTQDNDKEEQQEHAPLAIVATNEQPLLMITHYQRGKDNM